MTTVGSIEQLEAIYGFPAEASTVKVTPKITDEYAAFIKASPFLMLATSGPEGLDCSPRGDVQGAAHVVDELTLHLPDRRGNNRIDSLRNIVRDNRVAVLFLIPGSGTTIRLNGTASITIDDDVLESFAVKGARPRSVIVITVQEVYFQCARAIVRSELWNPDKFVDPASLSTPGQILAGLSDDRVGGPDYDKEWPERARKTLW